MSRFYATKRRGLSPAEAAKRAEAAASLDEALSCPLEPGGRRLDPDRIRAAGRELPRWVRSGGWWGP